MVVAVRAWPEGPICSGCYATACETYGTCPGCGTDRLLPGRDAQARPVCTDCAGGIGNFTCTRCRLEGWNHYKGVCGRCVLRERLTPALHDGTGKVNPDLVPLLEHLCAMGRPRTGLLWLTKPHTMRLLRALAEGQVPLTHEGLAALQPYKAVAHLRQLLIAAGVLPDLDTTLRRIQEWTTAFLVAIPDADDRRTVEQYFRWQLQRRLHQAAARSRLHAYRDQGNRYLLRQALEFLAWLRDQDQSLHTLGQADLDRWVTVATVGQRAAVGTFLRWAARTGRAPGLRIPPQHHPEGIPLRQSERLSWLHRAATDDRLDGLDRVALTLLLLYAQPIPRITRLTTQDIRRDRTGHLEIRLGQPPAPVPAPFDQVLLDYLEKSRRATAANPDCPWLFPGRHGTLPLHPTSLRLRLATLGLQPRAARSLTLRQLVAEAPPAIIGEMLGYRTSTTERHAKQAGTAWSRYAALRINQG
ncbi:conserved hypothetical protein [Nostocoides japonicum T1-X7]|uniref:Site-specific recombinase XerD n=1 Tax=Nostocoides japonicum T1-X7 TaxID=1194083 RepID=A0A077M794_9MICO|nr:conserved hypothetical protein [Tetrasphaera japonica T1-X7]